MKLLLVLAVLMTLLGGASAGGYVNDQLEMSNYGLNYRLNIDPYHVGVSVEDDGSNEFSVEHFTEHVLVTYWNYVNVEQPGYNGYLDVAGFENMGGYIDEVYYIHAEARDARRMSLDQFVDVCMTGYYGEDFMGGHYEIYATTPGDYYVSRTGSGTVEGDWLSPDMGSVLVTTTADTADWNGVI